MIEVPLYAILDDGNKTVEHVTSPADPGFAKDVPAYKPGDNTIIWGATAMILSELEVILKEWFDAPQKGI